jgi:hypothetical protein
MDSFALALNSLTSVAVLIFLLGFIGARINSDLRIPEPVYQMISIFLLLGIGLKGGHSLKAVQGNDFVIPAIVTIILGLAIPALAFATLKLIKSLNDTDRGAIAAHYGSTSLVTFSAAILFLESNQISVEGYATLLLTLLEIPGIIVGIYLGSRHLNQNVKWGKTLHEVVTGKTILLLVGGLVIGAITSESGYEKVSPFFIDLQNGFLTLFLLHLGFLAGSNWFEIKKVGLSIAAFAVLFPLASGAIGVIAGSLAGLSIGGAAVLGVLSASASYIAAPAAVAVGLPKANSNLAMMASIGVTFPFNLVFGIPIYIEIARLIG